MTTAQTIRRVQAYSREPSELAEQVGELARDARDALRVRVHGPYLHSGSIRLPFDLDVGGVKPLLLLATYTEQDVENTTLVTWKWIGGQARVTSLQEAPAGGTSVSLRFFAVRAS